MVIISLGILFDLGLPIFYKDRRFGKKYNEFNLFKFRTMKDEDGPPITSKNDQRVTAFGRVLRNYKIDELPQLINIMKGDINFVGPRPESSIIVKNNSMSFNYLNFIKPGITDISSIIFKDEAEIVHRFQGDMKFYINDIMPIKSRISDSYINRRMLWGRIVIIIATIASFIHYGTALKLIRTVFYINDATFCAKLNKLIRRDIF